MNVYQAIEKRKSVRAYKDRPIEKEKLARILEAARIAPSASNRQEWRFIVVQDAETRKKLSATTNSYSFVGDAPTIIVCCSASSDHTMPCGIKSFAVDVSIAIDHITLAAVEEGLGTCWIGGFDADKVKEILGIPEDIVVVELLPIGYPKDDSIKEKSRLSIDEIVKYETW